MIQQKAQKALYVAAKLNVADALAKGPLSIDELANQVGAESKMSLVEGRLKQGVS